MTLYIILSCFKNIIYNKCIKVSRTDKIFVIYSLKKGVIEERTIQIRPLC